MTGWPEPEAAPVAVVFRADASTAIGTGHVMRCLSIAAAVRQLGAVCHFVSREFEGHLFDVVREAGCTQHVVEGDETQWIDELLPRLGRPRVVLDHYGLDADVEMRVGLKAAGVKQDMGFITSQIGMFSYSGLTKDQMVRLRTEFGVYGTDTGRMCVAALNSKNIDYVCASIAKVV